EIERVIGDAEDRECCHLPPTELPTLTAEGGEAEDQNTGEREGGRQQNQRRAIGDADLAGDEGKAPEQAEQADIERQRIEAAARGGNGDGGRDGHGRSPSRLDLGPRIAIWKLNDRLDLSG